MKPPGVEVVELDIRPAGLIDHLEGRSCLVIVDALYAPGIPGGEVLDIDWFDEARPALCHDDVLSTHGLGIAQQLELAKQLGLLPPVVRLIGMTVDQPPEVGQADIPWMSRCVARATELIRGYTEQYTASNREPTHA